MLILPLKFIREEDKKTVGLNLYHLAKLGHLGLPVIDSVIAIPPSPLFEKVLNKYLRHNFNIADHLNNIKTELLNISPPESIKSFELVSDSKAGPAVDIAKLWQNLLKKWVDEIMSKIQRGEKNFSNLTAQLVVISANFTAFGKGFFDEDRNHAVIKVEQGEINMQASQAIENLIIVGNKKLLLPQVYYWGIEDGKIKIVKVMPFTQSLHDDKKEDAEKIVSVQKNESKTNIKTATRILLDYRNNVLTDFNSDGTLLNISKLDTDSINNKIEKISKFDPNPKIIFFPDLELTFEKNLQFGKEFLFFRNKRKVETQIVLPETFSVDEFLNLKREFASLGIYSKGSLKIWKQFNTAADFLNLDDYLDAGFDGAVIDLDKISKIVCGVDGETVLLDPQIDRITAIEKFFKELGLSEIVKNLKPVLLKGKLSQNEELLNYFIRSGVWGICFEGGMINPMREHISFLEKQVMKKLSRIEIQH